MGRNRSHSDEYELGDRSDIRAWALLAYGVLMTIGMVLMVVAC